MKSYLSLIPISAKVRRRQNRMTLICIVIAVFLVTAIFSMVDACAKMETANLIRQYGNWHISLNNVSKDVPEQIRSRSDVSAVGRCDGIDEQVQKDCMVGSQQAMIYGADAEWATAIRNCVEEGSFPKNKKEIMLSPNAKDLFDVKIGDIITLKTPVGKMKYSISGFGQHDSGFHNFTEPISVYMDRTAFSNLCELNDIKASSTWYIRFRSDKGVAGAIREIKKEFGLSDKNVRENSPVLAVMGSSSNEIAQNLYPLAAILLVLVLVAAVLMISSSLNNNVAQRTQFFGMMRCIGMSRKQVMRFVRMEALNWCKTAVPTGIVLGIATTWGLCSWLKFGVGGEFAELSIFMLSPVGIVLGAVTGILTVFIAAQSPAKHAGKVSPAAAISGNTGNKADVGRTMRIHFGRIETALGINHAVSVKKNLILMTGSFALSIVLFFGFSAGLDFGEALMPSLKPWQPDFTVKAKKNKNEKKSDAAPIDGELAAKLKNMSGVDHVYGLNTALHVPVKSDKSVSEATLASYDDYLFQCAEESRVSGDFSKMSGDTDYVLAVFDSDNPLRTGDKIEVNGVQVEVAGMVSEAVYKNNITLICTEETYERLMGKEDYTMLSIQLSDGVKDSDVNRIRSLVSDDYRLMDFQKNNRETMAEYYAFQMFVYAFLVIIVLIAALNIINSTSMSVAAKMKQYGAMRAVGMSRGQVTRMISAEVFTYAISGCAVGCALGLPFNKVLYETFITAYFGEKWHVPAELLVIILLIMLAASVAAIYAPAKRMKNMAVTETINEL